MIDGAEVLFQDLPIDFGDPLSLAASQAPGKLTLIVACYTDEAPEAVYHAFVCKAPMVLMAVHITAAFKFPVSVSHAMARYHKARDEGAKATLSMYAIDQSQALQFLETVFFEPSLKLFMADAGHEFISKQVEQAACTEGLLELSDFSDPLHPVMALCPVNSVLTAQAWLDEMPVHCSNNHLRLYDRKKNQQAARDRGTAALDVDHMLKEAAHLSKLAQRETAQTLHLATERQEASIQRPAAKAQEEDSIPKEPQMKNDAQLIQEMASLLAGNQVSPNDEPADDTSAPEQPTIAIEVDHPGSIDKTPTTVSDAEGRRKLLAELMKIHQAVLNELSRQYGEERGNVLVLRAAETAAVQLPVSEADVLPFLKALVKVRPPGRWMRFRKKMNEVKDLMAADLTALFAAYNHLVDDPSMQEVSELWVLCSKA